MVYAVVTAVDKDVVGGVEEQWRGNREDTKDKAALVVTIVRSRSGGLPA